MYIQFVEQQNEHFILSACIAVLMASLDYLTIQIAHVCFLRQQKAIALVEIMLSTGHHQGLELSEETALLHSRLAAHWFKYQRRGVAAILTLSNQAKAQC